MPDINKLTFHLAYANIGTMKPEDFTNGPNYTHPEITDNPEAMQPATEATKQALLDLITSKSEGGFSSPTEVSSKTLLFTEPERGTISIARFVDGASKDDPSRMARVHRVEWPGKLYGEQFITNYFILKTPDGLQIEKHSQTFDPDKELLRDGATPEEGYQAAINGLAKITATREAHKSEDELGLSFVSEKEAKDILALVTEAQPRQR